MDSTDEVIEMGFDPVAYVLAKKKLSWTEAKEKLESEGAKNKQYDINTDGRIDRILINKPVTNPINSPLDITFSLKYAGYRPWIYDEKFRIFDDDFNIDKSNIYTIFTEVGATSRSISDGKLTVSITSNATEFYAPPITPKSAWLVGIIKVDDIAVSTGIIHVQVGLIQDVNNRIMAVYDTSGVLKIEAKVNGTLTEVASSSVTLTPPFYITVIFNGKKASLLYSSDGNNWTVALSDVDISGYFDLTNEATLTNMKIAYGGGGDTGNSYTLDLVKWYYYSGVGIRDIKPVTYKNGAPLIKENKLYCTATLAGLSGTIPASHYGVITIDLSNYHIEIVSLIFTRRSGLIVGDNAGHIIYDQDNDKYIVMLTNWGTWTGTSTNLLLAEVEDYILSGVHVIDVTEVNKPTTYSWKDPHIIYDESVSKWRMAVSETDYSQTGFGWVSIYESDDLLNWTQVSTNTTYTDIEGMVMSKVGGKFYIFTKSNRVYSYPNLSYIGVLSAPQPGTTTWQAVVPIFTKGKTKFLSIEFDLQRFLNKDYSHGSLYISEGDLTEDGYEYFVYD